MKYHAKDMNIIDGKALAAKIRLELKEKVEKEKITPGLAVIFVGEDEASKIYVRNKNKACEEVGIKFKEFRLPTNVTREQLIDVIEKANNDNEINGILLQSP